MFRFFFQAENMKCGFRKEHELLLLMILNMLTGVDITLLALQIANDIDI